MTDHTASEPQFTNRLINETSPYLLQHVHNPVDWYPWNEQALERAKREDKPILLSIGYSACHWCHVMAHESFEDEAIAKLMNDNFINIKVDREERPDLDTIYMNAVQMMTGHGGWPMTMFLTPDGRPFYGGTYFPPADRHNLPGFPRLLIALSEAWRDRRDEIEQSANGLTGELRRLDLVSAQTGESSDLGTAALEQATKDLLQRFDREHGGFGRAPKFPPSMTLSFLLRQFHRTRNPELLHVVEVTLEKMARGGMYDQLGGGFHRYSVDEHWLVPHFEKMLYDNALLARIYTDAFLVTGNAFYQTIATETLDYVRREMTDASGGFYSSQDADSEGEEGKFFVWTPAEVEALLGAEQARLFNRYFDVTAHGNFEESNILHIDVAADAMARLLSVTPEAMNEAITSGKRVLLEAREGRIKPHRDEKMLTAWNGLMLRAFAESARALRREDYLQIAINNAEFLVQHMLRDGRLLRTHKEGASKLNGYLEDYAYVADGMLALYEATFDGKWFAIARQLVETMIDQFWDEEGGGFYFTSADHEQLVTRSKDFYDNATPAGNSVAADLLLRLSLLTGEDRYRQISERILRLMQPMALRAPSGFGHLLGALDLALSAPLEIAIIGNRDESRRVIDAIWQRYLPNKVVAFATGPDDAAAQTIKLLAGRTSIGGRPTVYVCRNFTCEMPITERAVLIKRLETGN